MNSKVRSSVKSWRWIRRLAPVVAIGAFVPVFAGRDVSAQPKAAAPAAAVTPVKPGPAEGAKPERDPKAIDAIEKMGAYLRSLQTFAVRADGSTDDVLATGQKIQFTGVADIHVKRPDKLRIDLDSDRKHRRIYYDGKAVTLYAPRVNYYGSVPAPGSIKDMLEMVDEKYDVELPLADLFYWGTDAANIAAITSAIEIGPSTIGGVDCDHYAYRQAGEDWQVWIEKGATPLPRKLVITTLDDPAQPQHTEILSWDLKYKPVDDAFVFHPPSGAQKIAIAQAEKPD